MPIVYDRTTCDVPVPLSSERGHFYANHPGGDAWMTIWYPRDAGGTPINFNDAHILMGITGGNFHNPGWRAIEFTDSGIGPVWKVLAERLNDSSVTAKPWVLISVHLPQSPSQLDDKRDHMPAAMWPEPQLYVRAAIAHIRDNASGKMIASTRHVRTSGAEGVARYETTWGNDLWNQGYSFTQDGEGNSVSGKVFLVGLSAAGTNALANMWMPEAIIPAMGAQFPALTHDRMMPRNSGRPTAVGVQIAQYDLTQLAFDQAQSDDNPFGDEHYQHLARKRGREKYYEQPLEWYQGASPRTWLNDESNTANRVGPVWAEWGRITKVEEASLTFQDDDPNRIQDDEDQAKAAFDFHHHAFARKCAEDIQDHGDARSEVFWGDAQVSDGLGPDVDKGPELATTTDKVDRVYDWVTGLVEFGGTVAPV